MFNLSMRSIEWTFVKKPLRRYESPKRERDPPIERHGMSTTSVLLDAFDLLFNMRGIGWSWSSKPFPRWNTPPPSIAFVFFKTVLLWTVFDASHYIIQCVRPVTRDGSLFDPSLALVPRTALAAFCSIVGGLFLYTMIDVTYHLGMLVGRIVFRQPASAWPPAFDQPWMSTSLCELWSFRWHQFTRRIFITYGARPGGKLFGRPGAVMGAFAVSSILHHFGLWAVGNGSEFATAGGFFLLMGVGTIMEGAFMRVTGMKVRGWLGWLWTALWMTLWGTFMLDGWARHGLMGNDYVLIGPRPGKFVVDAIIALSDLWW
jgi:hypothetical protein